VANIDQLKVCVDAGGGDVILDSAYALLRGLYPPIQDSVITLGQTALPGDINVFQASWPAVRAALSFSDWSAVV